jgi:plastocyanin
MQGHTPDRRPRIRKCDLETGVARVAEEKGGALRWISQSPAVTFPSQLEGASMKTDSSPQQNSSRRPGLATWAVLGATALIACALAVSCGSSDSTPGPDAGTDAGTPDAGTDAGTHDAGTDAGTADAGSDAGTASLNGCTTYADHSGSSDSRTIAFSNFQYTPPCMKILAGQTVTFSGTFGNHPLMPGVPSSTTGTSSPSNPITATNTGSTLAVTFPTAGSFGYYCNFHFGSGMYGAIEVQ